MAQDDILNENEVIESMLREKYRDEYRTLAAQKTNLLDRFRSHEDREARIDKLTDKLLTRALRNGELQARAEEELGLIDEQKIAKLPEEDKPGAFDFLGMDKVTADEVPNKNYEGEYKISIPNTTALKAASDEQFLGYVLDSLDRYNIKSPGFIAVPEMNTQSGVKRVNEKGEKAQLIGTFIKKKFNVVSSAGGNHIERAPEVTDTLLCMHSDEQVAFINTAAVVVAKFNETGQVDQHLRERFIFEQTRDELRNSSYAKTKKYEEFCHQAIAHVLSKMETIGLLTQPQQQQGHGGAYLDTRPPMKPTKVSVSFSFDPGKKGA